MYISFLSTLDFDHLETFLNIVIVILSPFLLIFPMVTKSVSSNSTSASSESFKKKSTSPASFSMNNVIDKIKKADKDLDTMLSKQAFVLKLERQSGVKKTHMIYGIAALAGLLILYRLATNFVMSVVLLAYPLILSLEAVESHDKAKDAHILAYWSIISFIQLLEAILPFLRRIIPFYNLLKLTLAVYLYLPETKVKLLSFRFH